MAKPKWENVIPNQNYDQSDRLRVPGGWIFRNIDGAKNPAMIALCFVPDPEHKWDISDNGKEC